MKSILTLTIFLIIHAALARNFSGSKSDEAFAIPNNTKEELPKDDLVADDLNTNKHEVENDDVYELNLLKYQKEQNAERKWENSLKKLHSLHSKAYKSMNPSQMLRHLNEKYSAYDLAQYVFWTGDEDGVSKAVEELIDQGLMTRENALEFLNDIRLGMDYLQNLYGSKSKNKPTKSIGNLHSNDVEDDPLSSNLGYQIFKSFSKQLGSEESNSIADKYTTSATPKVEGSIKTIEENSGEDKTLCGVAGLLYEKKLDYLEKVIYQLSKALFVQSLTHDSKESQAALQNFTKFLENEGSHAAISQNLQKKVLDILLAALSDTLDENPELANKTYFNMTK